MVDNIFELMKKDRMKHPLVSMSHPVKKAAKATLEEGENNNNNLNKLSLQNLS